MEEGTTLIKGAGAALVVGGVEFIVALAILGRSAALFALLPVSVGAVVLGTALSQLCAFGGPSARKALQITIWNVILALFLLPDGLAGQRDAALLLLGFATGLRRSELVALDLADVRRVDEGLTVAVRRSKTDQEGVGRRIGVPYGTAEAGTCPVLATRRWIGQLHDAGHENGPLFVSIDRWGNLGGRLSDRSVAAIIKKAATSAGLEADRYAGHSLRAGLATAAAAAGKPERAISRQTGHRSMTVLRGYIRDGSLFRDNAAQGIGL